MFGSEAATEITLPELRQPFCFCSGNSAVEGDEEEIYHSRIPESASYLYLDLVAA